MDPLKLLQELVSLPGPPGQEDQVRAALQGHLSGLGLQSEVDAKGNLIVRLGSQRPAKLVVTAHMDEIAMTVRQLLPDGSLKVSPLGGLFPWKLGEGPVLVMADSDHFESVLGFGSIHTESDLSHAKRAKSAALTWEAATVLTGRSLRQLHEDGVRPGTRVVIAPSRRQLTHIGEFVAGYFLDDRADLVAWLLALELLKGLNLDATFVATVSEEVGGEGAQYFLQREPAAYCIALELGPNVPDAPVEISDVPTVWVADSYASAPPSLLACLAGLGFQLQSQMLSRGGSDASIAASRGLCAHHLTLGLPMENSHGFELIHPGSMGRLAEITSHLVRAILASVL